ncbi:hypothetical protein G7Z17_g281 [Cylindrodendrum hubeiense]|uniref:Uncharacterized protein n=1 Tax=Cylindrodendrum hubeiense TaxID=595255 RepID=A0A9P5HSL2_9HYPO|nr:hypothetical protein G7Z17_g281 [Cylindrodendrum hubeiense]
MADMVSRIASLEKSLAEARDEAASVPEPFFSEPKNTAPSVQLAMPTPSGNLGQGSRDEIVVQKGSSSQYFNEIILSKVIQDERNIDSILTPPHTGSPHPAASSPFDALGILSSPSLSITPASLHPSQELAAKLWKIYVENVEACMGLKVLHIPTDEIKVYSVINDPTTAPLDKLSLSFAILFASTLKVGLEQAFAHGNFLDRPTITGLHALAIYLPSRSGFIATDSDLASLHSSLRSGVAFGGTCLAETPAQAKTMA